MTRIQRLKHNLIGNKAFYGQVMVILVPLVIQNTVSNVVSLVDNIMVGRVGTLEMSAVAIVNQLLFVFYLAIFGGLAGAGIFSAQFVGAGDHKGVRHCFRMKMYIATLTLVLALAIFILLPDKLISLYLAENTTPADAAQTLMHGKNYLGIMLLGLPPFAISQVYASTLREMGETKVPMLASLVAIGSNCILNYILIFGSEGLPFLPFGPMGVEGAAIGTAISRFAETAIIVIYVHTHREKCPFIKGAYKSLAVPKKLTKDIVKKGFPLFANEILWSMGMAAMMQCYSVRGLEVVAATNIATTVSNLFNVVFLAMGSAIAIIIGQQLGAGEIEKAKTTVWRLLALTVFSCVILGGIMAALAPYIPLIYNTTDTVRLLSKELLFVFSAVMPFLGFAHGCYFALRSGGKTGLTFAFDCGFTWVVIFPTAFILANFTDISIVPLFIAVQSIEVVKSLIFAVLIKKGIWINNIIK